MKLLNGSIILLLICSCNTGTPDKNLSVIESDTNLILAVNAKGEAQRDSIPTILSDDKTSNTFQFNVDSAKHILKSITIYFDTNIIQVIKCKKLICDKGFQLIDWNFDGFKDISVSDCGSGGCVYWIWNYSPKRKKYNYNEELSEKIGLEIDTAGRNIIFHYRAGFQEENWDTFQYRLGKLIFIKGLYRERWNDSLGNMWVKHTYSKTVGKRIIQRADSSIFKRE